MDQSRQVRIVIGLLLLFAFSDRWSPVLADPVQPVAVRWWGRSMVSIETYWNLRVVIDPFGSTNVGAEPNVNADLMLITRKATEQIDGEVIGRNPTVVHVLDAQGNGRPLQHVLDRLPNEPAPTWKESKLGGPRSGHEIVVTSIPLPRDGDKGQQRRGSVILIIEVDGVRIVHCGGLGQRTLTNEQLSKLGLVDVLLIPVGGNGTVDGHDAARVVRHLKPRIVVPIRNQTATQRNELQPMESLVDLLTPEYQVDRPVGNTLAVRQADRDDASERKIAILQDQSWSMPEELAALFSRKEAACRASQAVFAELSSKQMNFSPSNGTHTPRWNAEHMMGRELGFFSQIFAQVDPAVPHIDLNPQQMPAEYVAAHPDWSGEEEARQMERVRAFSRRFAYLLNGLDLDEKAPGSRWSPRALLRQMERHYNEHTQNVKKKLELPDWPRQRFTD